MKATSTFSILVGLFATLSLAQDLAPAIETSAAIAPIAAGDDVELPMGGFPIPTEMQKRQGKSGRLDKRHYGVF